MVSSRVQINCPKCGESFLPSVKAVQSTAGKSSRRKGHAFERRVAKLLQDWWNSGKSETDKPCEMKRSPQSGGSALKIGFRMHGDVVCNDPTFKYSIECKNAPGSFAGIHQFLSCEKAKLWDWLSQAYNDCPEDSESLLIVNRYDQPTWCIHQVTNKIDLILERLMKSQINHMVYHYNIIDSLTMSILIWKFDDMLASSPGMWV